MSLDAHLDVTIEGDEVTFRFTVANEGDAPLTLEFPSSRTTDVAVYEDESEVWRWSEGRMFAQAIESETLAPGETFTHDAAWPDPPPGTYIAVATLEARDRDVEVRETFRVPDQNLD